MEISKVECLSALVCDQINETQTPEQLAEFRQLFLEAAADCARALQEMDEARPLTDEEHEAAGWIFGRAAN